MKTFFICFSLKNSSVAEFFVALSNELAVNCRVFIISYDDQPHPFNINPDITILNWPSKRPTKWQDFIFLSRLINKNKPDTIISNFGAVNISLLAGYIYKVKNRVSWYHTHSSAHSNEKRIFNLRKRLVYRLATLLITNSNAAKEDLINHYGIPESRIEIYPNAVRIPLIKKGEVHKHKLVFAGRLHPAKGLDVLLHSLPFVIKEHPDLEVEIYGGHKGNKEMKFYEDTARRLNIDSNVHFRGFKTKEKVIKALADAYICVVPSYFEAFCYVVIESFSVSTPVIGSKTTGIAEIIRDGEDGYLFETGNSNHLMSCLLKILNDPEKRNILAENAYHRFLDNYELNFVIRNLSNRLNA